VQFLSKLHWEESSSQRYGSGVEYLPSMHETPLQSPALESKCKLASPLLGIYLIAVLVQVIQSTEAVKDRRLRSQGSWFKASSGQTVQEILS
jgi:hypothetical protein